MEFQSFEFPLSAFSVWVRQNKHMIEISDNAEDVIVISRENGRIKLNSNLSKDAAYALLLTFIDEHRRQAAEPADQTLMRVRSPAVVFPEPVSKANKQAAPAVSAAVPGGSLVLPKGAPL